MLTTLANPDQVESVQLYKNGGVGALNDMGTQEGCGTLTRTLTRTLPLPLPLSLWARRRLRCTRSDGAGWW